MEKTIFSYEKIENTSFLVYKATKEEIIEKTEHNMLIYNDIKGLLKVSCANFDGIYHYKFDLTSKTSLKKYLQHGCKKETILKLLEGLGELISKSKEYLLSTKHIIYDEDKVFVEVSSSSLYFVYLPIDKEHFYTIQDLVKKIVFSVKIDEFEDKKFIEFLKQIVKDCDLGSENIAGLIKEYKQGNYKDDVSDTKEKDRKLDNLENRKEEDKTNINLQKSKTKNAVYEKVITKKNSKDSKNILKSKENKTNSSAMGSKVGFLVPESQVKTEIVPTDNNNVVETIKKSIFKNLFSKKNSKEKIDVKKTPEKIKSKSMHENNHEITIEPVIIDESLDGAKKPELKETVLLKNYNKNMNNNPYLIRLKTNEIININCDFFRIGKDIGYADYAIKDNDTVSRAHADIVKIENDYFIQDNNSKNHTYLNDEQLNCGEVAKLEHDSKVKLSNEEFLFRLT